MLFPPTQTTSLLSPSSSYTMNYPFLSTPNFALPTISQLPPTPQSRNSPVPQVPNRPTGRPPRLPSINSLHLPGLLRQQPHPPTSPPRDQESRATSPTQARNKPVSRRTPSGHRIAARRTFSLKESYPVKEPPAPPAEKDQKVSSAHKQLPPTVGLSVFFWGGGPILTRLIGKQKRRCDCCSSTASRHGPRGTNLLPTLLLRAGLTSLLLRSAGKNTL